MQKPWRCQTVRVTNHRDGVGRTKMVWPDLKQVKKNVKSRTRSDTNREGSAVTEGDQRTSKGAGSAEMDGKKGGYTPRRRASFLARISVLLGWRYSRVFGRDDALGGIMVEEAIHCSSLLEWKREPKSTFSCSVINGRRRGSC
jgi:hypothetical protein